MRYQRVVCACFFMMSTGAQAQSPSESFGSRSPASLLMVIGASGGSGAKGAAAIQRIGQYPELDMCKHALDTMATKSLAGDGAAADLRLICVETGYVEAPREGRRSRR